MHIVQVKNLKKIYPLGKVFVEAVKGIDFEIEQGAFVSISGPSGSGKSTILNMIGLIDTPTAGELIINEQPIYSEKDFALLDKYMKKNKKAKIPARLDRRMTGLRHEYLGFIFQSFNLVPVLNVYENIEFPLLFGKQKESSEKRKEWIEYLIERVGLTEWKHHKSNELSGGQRQRVAIARALATKPEIVLADEPTANLDSKTGTQILELMKEVNRELKTTFIFSTHDAKIVNLTEHRIKILDGNIVENIKVNLKNEE
ncbi:ABC transporter ATP-binding protein [Treponema phagedenis]|uniref:ABC transporter ATP-binding protein n=1 Tax=Treponema phagedenis TaxID=162 RepID=UPI0001F63DC8|nr:ABC transporter ATP-binding protein [Treponema phagedenis]EFW38385.1 ABC transporter, ATP-binding protein [Treponema phagedenis F0421]QSH98697.1 ABC transporter ATP-binding protein [Treponema phagedenis]TYT78505.1 ABC transporter ATP-binding protein [Treponema phagedenis]